MEFIQWLPKKILRFGYGSVLFYAILHLWIWFRVCASYDNFLLCYSFQEVDLALGGTI